MDTYTVFICPREKLDPYIAMIYSKWLRSLRYGNDYFRLAQQDSYYRSYHHYIERLLAHPGCTVRLAVLTDDMDVVLGFSISRGTVLDYIHVHKDQRGQGIGKSLLPKGITTITHLTRTGLSIWGSRYSHWKFDPFI